LYHQSYHQSYRQSYCQSYRQSYHQSYLEPYRAEWCNRGWWTPAIWLYTSSAGEIPLCFRALRETNHVF
jgi:hypothetical protein